MASSGLVFKNLDLWTYFVSFVPTWPKLIFFTSFCSKFSPMVFKNRDILDISCHDLSKFKLRKRLHEKLDIFTSFWRQVYNKYLALVSKSRHISDIRVDFWQTSFKLDSLTVLFAGLYIPSITTFLMKFWKNIKLTFSIEFRKSFIFHMKIVFLFTEIINIYN